MAISGVTTNISGRKFDLSILQGADPYKTNMTQPVAVSIGAAAKGCTGIQKLVQRYAITMFTRLRSQPLYQTFGTNLLTDLQKARIRSEIQHSFAFANALVLELFREYQQANPDLPLDEQIDTAVLEFVDFSDDTLKLRIKLSTLAGDSVSYVLPTASV